MPDLVAGFWSYVQEDDRADGGRILSLATKLRGQYRLLTAEELSLFVDRESLEWGAEWSHRIEEAIAGTTFFIPIITPSYFKSQACRRELLKFTREAKRLGLEQLLMPVYWVTVAELEDDPESSTDEAIRLVSRYQWQDLREVRLEDEDSSAFRKAVSRLAGELATRAARVTSTVQDAPGATAPVVVGEATGGSDEDDEAPGILEKWIATEEGFPELTNIMEEIGKAIERVGDLVQKADERMRAADARGQGMKAQLVQTERLARELDQPTQRIEQLGHRYVEVLATLDPGVHAMLDLASARPAEDDEDEASRAEYLSELQSLARSADKALEQLDELVQATKQAATFSRSLRAPLRRMRTGLQGVLDGRDIIEEWGRRAEEIEDRESGSDEPGDDGDGPLPSGK